MTRAAPTNLMLLRTPVLLLLLSTAIHPVIAQQPSTSQPLSVYLDCESSGCDFDFFRTDITAVNWVRDRQVADVHLLVSTQSTGAGGREYTVTFIGLRTFANLVDTLTFVSPPAATDDDRRRGLSRVFRAGLVRYVARTSAAERLTVSFGTDTTTQTQASAKTDPWNYWVFQLSGNSYFSGEKTYHDFNSYSNFNADRVTADWKTRLSLNHQYSQSMFIVSATDTIKKFQRGQGASLLQVKSLGEHWSAGLRGSVFRSTFDNYRRAIRLTPAIEYDVFPYSQSTRRQLRVEYDVGVTSFTYYDTTILNKTSESMPMHRLLASIASREPWGSIDVGINAINYLNDRTKYRLGAFGEMSFRLFKGFSLRAFGSYEVIRDQFNLPKKEANEAEILTRQFQLPTTNRYWGSVGLSYTFGSIYNNVVNPRFSGGFFD